ncbi:MAG: ATP-binding protein [Gaiellaceae bacterium]
MGADLPAGTVTFLFTDIEGSTRLIEDLGEDGYVDALAAHRRALRQAFAARGGVEVDTQGDAFLYVFSDPSDALQAAAHGQEALASGAVRVRMGVHTGAARMTDEGYAGRELHRAARIAASAHGGQVVVSAATRELVDGEVTELGEHRLKDFDEPVLLFQLGLAEFPLLKTISNTNLPRPASSFVGRQRERDELVALLADGARLVTLSGPGGSGKTRLAIEAASELVPTFKAGVIWVGLARLRDPALVAEEIAQTLGAKEDLAEHVGERELLLLLDNFEQVVDAAPALSELLRSCPNLKLLFTSRELLRIHGEVEFSVPPLAQPEAIELFCVRSQLEPDEEISELCRQLDELPLAVELAAGRTSVLTPAQILKRLSQRLDLFKGGRDADPRQQTLRATMEWSHDLLGEAEKRLFTRLSVFAGGCTLEAAEEIAGADLDTLQSLVDKSLLRHSGDRFWLLETIREFATERLRQLPDAHEVSSRHANWYAGVADRADEHMRGPEEADWLDQLEAELGNMRAALAWFERMQAAAALQTLSAALLPLWGERGHWREGVLWLENALAFGDGDPQARVRALIALCVLDGDLNRRRPAQLRPMALEIDRIATELDDTVGRARARTILGWAAGADGDRDEAQRMHEQSVALARASGDPWSLSVALNNLGDVHMINGDFDAAAGALGDALAVVGEVDYPDATGRVLHNLGLAVLARGDADRAAEHLSEAVTLFATTGSVVAGDSLLGLAAVANAKDKPRRATRLLGASNRVAEEAGQPRDIFETSLYENTLTAIRSALGDQTAAELLAEGEKMPREEAIAYALADAAE